jgi:outer membrane lipoprotein SlyB
MANKAVFCIVSSEEQASRIVDDLRNAGCSSDDVSALFPDKGRSRDFAHEQQTKAPEGATTGGVAGGLLGGTLGWLAGIGALAIPGLGPFVAAGPIMGLLSGAAVGAATGGIVGALVGYGMPEIEAKQYEAKVRDGNILMSVHTEDRQQVSRVKEIMKRNGARDITYTGEAGVPRSEQAHV